MRFSTYVSNLRSVVSSSIRITTIAAVACSIHNAQAAHAGLIEAAKHSSSKASSAKAAVDSGDSPADDSTKNKTPSVLWLLKLTGNSVNMSAGYHAKSLDLSTLHESKTLDLTLGEFTAALINAHASASLRFASSDDAGQVLRCCDGGDASALSDQDELLSIGFKDHRGDHINQFQVCDQENDSVFLHLRSQTASDQDHQSLHSRAAAFTTTFIAKDVTPGKTASIRMPERAATDQEYSDGENFDEESDEGSWDEKSDDFAAEDPQLSFADADAFDPWKASVAFLVIGIIALIVNIIPRMRVLSTQA